MVASSSAVSSAEKSTSSLRRLDTAALAAASGVRRSWLTADSSERRSSSACAIASALPASSVSSRCLTRPAACLATAPSTRRSRAASLLAGQQHPELVVADFDGGVGGVDVDARVCRRRSRRSRRRVASVTRSRLTARCEYVSRTRSSKVSRSAPRSTEPGEQREQFGLLRCAPGLARALRGAVDQGGHRHGDDQQHHDGDRVVGLGDGERVAGFDQEVVQQQSGQQGRQRCGCDAAEQRHDQHADEEERALAADVRGSGRAAGRSARRSRTEPRRRQARTPGGCCRGEVRDHSEPRRASGWVTMCTSILPDCCTTDAPMPSSKIRAHRDRRDVPITSWVAFSSRAKSSRALGTSSPTTVCRVAPRLTASSRTLPICGADTPESPSPRTTCTTISSALDFDAMRDALRTRVSDSGPPVTATTTRSRASQVSVIWFSSRYFSSAASTWSASHSSASSRSAVRLPAAEVVGQRRVDAFGRVHVAVGEPAPQRFRRDVDQLDLVGGAHHLVGHLLLLLDAGDLGDDVVEAFQVLDVDRGDDGDAGVEQLLDVLPALGVLAARGVGVGELVDQHDLRAGAPAPRRRRARRSACRGTRCSAAGSTSMPSSRSAVFLRPCVSTTAATRSVPRSSRRCASPSIAYVLPTPGAAPR